MDLIRPEARAARRDDGLGHIDLTVVRLHWALPGLILALLSVLALFVIFGQHQRRVQASGQLVSTEGLIDIVAPTAGVVETLAAHEGQRVAAGDLLGTLFVDTTPGSGAPVGLAIEEVLQRQHAQRLQDLHRVDAAASLRARTLGEQSKLELRQLAALRGQRPAMRARLAEARSFLERVQRAGKGALSEVQLRAYQAEVASHESALAELDQREMELEQRHGQTRAALAALPLETEKATREIGREIADLEQASARNSLSRSIELRAARDGVIAATLATQGQSVTTGQPVLQMNPAGSLLEAELWLPSEAVGAIAEGTIVQLRFKAFPFRIYGLQPGRVKSIGQTALAEDSVRRLSGLASSGPRYRVRVSLPQQRLLAQDGSERTLRLGMMFDADLLLDRQPIYRSLWPDTTTAGLAGGGS
jgi:membrane fusion protein